MKQTFLLLFFLCIITSLGAQNSVEKKDTAIVKKDTLKRQSYLIELSGGYSLVLGRYGEFDKSEDKAGYADNGWLVQFTFGWIGKKNLGLVLQYTFQKNPLQDSTEFLVPDGWTTGTLGPGYWRNHYLMLGPAYMINLKKLYLEARVLGGVIVSSSSNFNTPDMADTTGKTMDSNLGTGFAMGISTGVGYNFSKHITLKLNLGYLVGWPGQTRSYGQQLLRYEEIKDPFSGVVTGYIPVYSAPVEFEIKKVVSAFNPSLGLLFRF